MPQDDTGSAWEIGQEVSYGRTEPTRSGRVPATRESAADTASQIPVLARLPDLDGPKPSRRRTRRPLSSPKSDGRMISQGLSMKLLAGGALILVGLAVIPWLLGGKGEPKDKTGLPAWEQEGSEGVAPEASRYETDDPAPETPPQELAESAWPTPPPSSAITGVRVPEPAAEGPDPGLLPAPGQSPGQPLAPGGAPGSRWPVAVPPATTAGAPAWPETPQTPVVNVPPHEAAQQPPYGQPPAAPLQRPELAGPQQNLPWQAGGPYHQTGDPAATTRPGAWAMRPMQLGSDPTSRTGQPVGSGSPDYGQPPHCAHCPDHAAPAGPHDPANWQPPPRADVAPPPSGQGAPGPSYGLPPVTTTRAPGAEPGVARFQGIIEGAPVRTTYDRARSGIY